MSMKNSRPTVYTYLITECWHGRVNRVCGVGVNLKYKYDETFRNAIERKLMECLFTDDEMLASSRLDAEGAVSEFAWTLA